MILLIVGAVSLLVISILGACMCRCEDDREYLVSDSNLRDTNDSYVEYTD